MRRPDGAKRTTADGARALRAALLEHGGALAEAVPPEPRGPLAESVALEPDGPLAESVALEPDGPLAESVAPEPHGPLAESVAPEPDGPLAAAAGAVGAFAEELPALSRGLRAALDGQAPPRPGPAQTASAGPRTAGLEAEYELLLEMILEGARLHYTVPHVLGPADDDDALLLGDQLYALGLTRLAALGDLAAVAELADVISLVAQTHADGDPALAEAVWHAGAVAIGWGSSSRHEAAKAAARDNDPQAKAALRSVAASVLEFG